MKKVLIVLCLALLLVSTIKAVNPIYDLNMDVEQEVGIILGENEAVRITVSNQTHLLVIDEITVDGAKLDIFVNETIYVYGFITMDRFALVDLDKNGQNDLRIDLRKIDKEENTVTIKLLKLEQQNTEEPIQEPETNSTSLVSNTPKMKIGLAIIGVFIIIGLIIYLASRKK